MTEPDNPTRAAAETAAGRSAALPVTAGEPSHDHSRRLARSVMAAAVVSAAAVVIGLVFAGVGFHTAATLTWRTTAAVALVISVVSVGRQVWRRQLGVDVLALAALAGTLAVGEDLAGAVVAAMVASGRALEAYAEGRAQRELRSLLARAPRTAHLVSGAEIRDVPLGDVADGDTILVRPGEVIPVDGVVVGCTAVVDESALTGEVRAVDRAAGETIFSGTVNAGASLQLRAVATADDSTYASIIRLVSQATSSRAPMMRLADRWAGGFVLATILAGIIAAVLTRDPRRVVAILVVATPCPLLLAVPVALISGVSRAAAQGIIVKGAAALERLARVDALLIDKTGTLTAGKALLRDIESPVEAENTVLLLAASAEQHSHHALATSIVEAALARALVIPMATGAREDSGRGVAAVVNGTDIRVGRLDWVADQRPDWTERLARRCALDGSSMVAVARGNEVIGVIVLDDFIRPDSARTLRRMRRDGIRRIIMVTGDRQEIATPVGHALGLDSVVAECSPADKVDVVRAEGQRSRGGVIMVGDGINDAAALAAADVGVALGARGSSSSSEAADIVITVDRLDRLGVALRIATRTRRIATQSVVLGMGLSGIAMLIAGLGFLTPVAGAFLQEAIDVIAILNALRALGGDHAGAGQREAAGVTARFRGEHDALRGGIERIRATADGLEGIGTGSDIPEVRELYRFLVDVMLVHERAEETELYPVIARLVGGDDPTGPMSLAHTEIERLIHLVGLTLDEIGRNPPSAVDITELRRLLYGLHAILRLHTAQEDEAYLSLVAPIGSAQAV